MPITIYTPSAYIYTRPGYHGISDTFAKYIIYDADRVPRRVSYATRKGDCRAEVEVLGQLNQC